MNEYTNNNCELKKNKGNKLKYLAICLIIIGLILILLSFFIKKDNETGSDDNKNNNNEVNSTDDNSITISKKKKTTMNSINAFITEVTININNMDYGSLSDSDILYYIPVSNINENSCVTLERGGNNSLGNWKEAYVVVNFDADYYTYNYYFTFYDDAGFGMELTNSDDFMMDGGNIKSPIPEKANFGNITKQLNDKASTVKILLTPSEAKKTGVEACSIYTAKDN